MNASSVSVKALDRPVNPGAVMGPIAWTLEPIGSLDELQHKWTAVGGLGSSGFFRSWSWIGTWLAALPAGTEPMLLRASVAGLHSALAIVVPYSAVRRKLISSRALHLNATGDAGLDCITIEHNGFAADHRLAGGLFRSLLDWFAHQQTSYDELYLSGLTLPLTGSLLTDVAGVVISPTLRRSYYVDLKKLSDVAGDLSVRLSANARRQVRQAFQDYERSGSLRIEEARNIDQAFDFFNGLKQLHIKSWTRRQRPHSFLRPFFETFHRALIRECLPKGEIQLLHISAGSHTIGYLYNFRQNKRIYAYQSGFDDSDRRTRPGYVSHVMATKYNWQQGMEVYDLLAGDNRLKQRFATNVEDMYWYRVYRPLLRYRIENNLHRVKELVQKINEQEVSF